MTSGAYGDLPKFENLRLRAHLTQFGPDHEPHAEGGLILEGKPLHTCNSCGCAYQGGTREIRLTFNEALVLAHWILDTCR